MRSIVVAALGCSLAWCLIGSVAFAGGPRFTDKFLADRYSFKLAGAQSGSTTVCPVSADGVLNFNGRGTVSGGTILYNDCTRACTGSLITGTYAVNPDGTGEMTLLFDGGACNTSIALGLDLAMLKAGKQAYLSGQSTGPVSAVMSGELSLQKNFP
jgi:hypothetical protein